MIRRLLIALTLIVFGIKPIYAETVNVGLEPLPPLITENAKGYSVEILRALEKKSDLKFNIQIMPYNRAKKELHLGRLDMIGHTPYQKETHSFYKYAQEINWRIDVVIDSFGTDKTKLNNKKLGSYEKVGIPVGNEQFISQMFNIPTTSCVTSTLERLVKMLEKDRIDVIVFDRASVMTTINKLRIKNIYYQLATKDIAASFATRRDDNGDRLRIKLEKLLNNTAREHIIPNYLYYLNLPDSGIVPIDE